MSKKEKSQQIIEEEKNLFHKKRIAIVAGFVLVVMFAIFMLWISGRQKSPSETVVFRVGEESVYLDEVNLCILENMTNLKITKEMLDETDNKGVSMAQQYKDDIANIIYDYKVEVLAARQQGVALSEDTKQIVRSDAISYVNSVDGHVFRKYGLTKERVIEIYMERALAGEFEREICKDLESSEVTYCTMYALYFPKIEMLEDGSYATMEDGVTPVMLSDEELQKAKEQAQQAREDLQSGEQPEDVAKKYGVDQFSEKISNTPEGIGEPFAQYATKLEDGACSEVIDIQSSYVVLMMLDQNDEETAEQISAVYQDDMKDKMIAETRELWYEKLGISKNDNKSRVWDTVSLYDFLENE